MRFQAVKRLARALDVDERSLRVLQEIAGNHRLLTRFDMMRRIMGKIGRDAYDEEGLGGVRKIVAGLAGKGEDAEVAWKYKSLGLLPEGTLGRTYWEHCTRRKFSFPGEPGGIPERMVFHDFGHVLAGYDTDPEGEIQQGAFQAGFIREDGFAFLSHYGSRLPTTRTAAPPSDATTPAIGGTRRRLCSVTAQAGGRR